MSHLHTIDLGQATPRGREREPWKHTIRTGTTDWTGIEALEAVGGGQLAPTRMDRALARGAGTLGPAGARLAGR